MDPLPRSATCQSIRKAKLLSDPLVEVLLHDLRDVADLVREFGHDDWAHLLNTDHDRIMSGNPLGLEHLLVMLEQPDGIRRVHLPTKSLTYSFPAVAPGELTGAWTWTPNNRLRYLLLRLWENGVVLRRNRNRNRRLGAGGRSP
jgi:hypothetical protein